VTARPGIGRQALGLVIVNGNYRNQPLAPGTTGMRHKRTY
jgi:hypothetical protein